MTTATTERIYKLTVDATQALNKLDKLGQTTESIDRKMGKFDKSLSTLSKTAKMVGGAFVALQAGMAVMNGLSTAFSRATEEIDNLNKSSSKIGITTEALSGLKYASEMSGVGFEALEGGLLKFNKVLADVGDESKKTTEILKQMGVNVHDTTETAFKKIANAFESLPDSASKSARAMELFGKSGADLIPLLNEGADGIEKLMERARELGLVIDQETADRITSFNDSLADMNKASEGITNQIVAGLAPALQTIAGLFSQSAEASDFWRQVGQGLGEALIYITRNMDSLITGVRMFIQVGQTAIQVMERLASFDASGVRKAVDNGFGKVGDLQKEFDKRDQIYKNFSTSFVASTKKIASASNGLAQARAGASKARGGGKSGKSDAEREAEAIEKEIEALKRALDPYYAYQQALENIQKLKKGGLSEDYVVKAITAEAEKYAKAVTSIEKETNKLNDALKAHAESVKDELDPMRVLKREVDLLHEAYAKGYLVYEEYTKARDNATKKAMEQANGLKDETKEIMQELEDAIAGFTSNFVNGLVDGLGQGRMELGKFAEDFIKMITKIMLNRMVTNFMKSFMGSGQSGNTGWLGDLMGSIFGKGATQSPAMIPVAIPKSDSNGIDTFKEGARFYSSFIRQASPSPKQNSGKPPPSTINVYNNSNSDVSTKETVGEDGSRKIDIYIEKKVKDMIANGSLDKSFKSSFGMRRSPA